MIGLDIHVTLFYPEELLHLVTQHLKLIYGDGDVVASSSSFF